jgi:hypothetical protein
MVAFEAAGQHNPLLSEGPLDWSACGSDPPSLPARATGEVIQAWGTYKLFGAKVVLDVQFEAVLGKTRRTEF